MSEPERHELHEALHGAADAATPRPIDVDAVLRASRSRRRARRTAVLGGAGAVAAVLVVGGLVLSLQQGFGPASGGAPAAVESAESGEPLSDDATGLDEESATGFRLMAPADVNRCGAPPETATDAATASLLVTVTPPASPVGSGASASATVTITNAGTASVHGELWGAPALSVVDDGVTVSQSPAVDAASVSISLDPGESTKLPGSFEGTRCTQPDAATPGPNETRAPLAPGAYELGAVVGFTPAGGEPVHLVSPLVPLTLD